MYVVSRSFGIFATPGYQLQANSSRLCDPLRLVILITHQSILILRILPAAPIYRTVCSRLPWVRRLIRNTLFQNFVGASCLQMNISHAWLLGKDDLNLGRLLHHLLESGLFSLMRPSDGNRPRRLVMIQPATIATSTPMILTRFVSLIVKFYFLGIERGWPTQKMGSLLKGRRSQNYGAIHFIFDNVSSNSHLIDHAPSCASFHSFMHAAICAFYRLSTPFHQ